MIIISIMVFILGTSLPVVKDSFSSQLLTRLSSILLFFCSLLTINTLNFEAINSGLLVYNGLLKITNINQFFSIFIYLISSIILLSIFNSANSSSTVKNSTANASNYLNHYYLIVLFNILAASFLILTSDLLTMFVTVELQSFSLYILASLNKESIFSTSAGLKYFLIGSLASAFILLGISIIYSATGITQFESLSLYLSVPNNIHLSTLNSDVLNNEILFTFANETIHLAFIFILCGLFIKLGVAPFHQWSPDVYDRVPTNITTWLVIIPKITLLLFIIELLNLIYSNFSFFTMSNALESNPDYYNALLQYKVEKGMNNYNYFKASNILSDISLGPMNGLPALNNLNEVSLIPNTAPYEWANVFFTSITTNLFKNFLLVTSFLSLVIGAVLGLNQIKIKRLLAYSGINHLGFLILSLAVNSKSGLESFMFYLIQYSFTTLNVFLIVLAFANVTRINSNNYENNSTLDLDYIKQFTGLFFTNPLLSLALALCLFSMAGVPPLLGFFAKQQVLYSSISSGYIFISIVAILMSVISAYYYLNIIKISHFNTIKTNPNTINNTLTNITPTAKSTNHNVGWKAGEVIKNSQNKIQNVHSYSISLLTLSIILFCIKPNFVLKSLIAVSYFIFDF